MKEKLLRLIALSFFITVSVVSNSGQDHERFKGKFSPELAPDLANIAQRVFTPVSDPAKLRFVPPIEKTAVVTSGDLIDERTTAGVLNAILVEPVNTSPFVCFDMNSDGVIDVEERFALRARGPNPDDLDVVVRHPMSNPVFKDFPVVIRYKRGFKHPSFATTKRLVLQTFWVHALGIVEISGRQVLFQYPFEPRAKSISTTEGLFGIDVDGDGKIRNEQFSPETSYTSKTDAVFRLGDLFVSTESADLAKNEIVVRKRTREEYRRHELEIGKKMPGFSFVDLEGNKRSLTEFKGKYLLVDFWGVWCVDCTRETASHVEAMKRFRDRGFDILSLNTDEDVEVVKGYLKENGITWTQARNDSIRELVEVAYRIQEYPSSILLGPDGKVLVLDQRSLRGERLLETLERIVPR